MITCTAIRHRFGDRDALRDVTLHVPAGAVFGFIGPNGAGKTTTIRVLATLLAPTAGTATIDGLDVVEHAAEVRRRVGYMPDNAGVYERITAGEYLDFFASACGIAPAKRARTVADAVELTEIGHLLPREVMALSKGQRQRLLLARTLLHDPRVLILDEPASDLDPRARIELRMLLTELARMGKTIFLSSHILTELADICSHVGIIEAGRVVAHGPIDAVQAARRPGRRVTLTVLGHADRVETSVKRFTFVQSVTALGEPEEAGPRRFELSFEGDDWRLSELVAAVVAAGVPVVAVEPERRDLERLFMDLTVGAQGPSPEGG